MFSAPIFPSGIPREDEMPQPRERPQEDPKRNQQDPDLNKEGPNKQDHEKKAQESENPREQRENPDRYPDQGKQARKPADVRYPEQDPSGKAERPDAVAGADAKRRDRGSWDDLN
jgi:hypothetical protein